MEFTRYFPKVGAPIKSSFSSYSLMIAVAGFLLVSIPLVIGLEPKSL